MERARPRAQQPPPSLTRWIFTDSLFALDAAAPEDGHAPLNRPPFPIWALSSVYFCNCGGVGQ